MGSWLKILSKYLAATYFQVVHLMSAQSFDERQANGSTPQSVLDTPAIAIMAKAMAADEDQSPAPSLEGKLLSHYHILGTIGRIVFCLATGFEELQDRLTCRAHESMLMACQK